MRLSPLLCLASFLFAGCFAGTAPLCKSWSVVSNQQSGCSEIASNSAASATFDLCAQFAQSVGANVLNHNSALSRCSARLCSSSAPNSLIFSLSDPGGVGTSTVAECIGFPVEKGDAGTVLHLIQNTTDPTTIATFTDRALGSQHFVSPWPPLVQEAVDQGRLVYYLQEKVDDTGGYISRRSFELRGLADVGIACTVAGFKGVRGGSTTTGWTRMFIRSKSDFYQGSAHPNIPFFRSRQALHTGRHTVDCEGSLWATGVFVVWSGQRDFVSCDDDYCEAILPVLARDQGSLSQFSDRTNQAIADWPLQISQTFGRALYLWSEVGRPTGDQAVPYHRYRTITLTRPAQILVGCDDPSLAAVYANETVWPLSNDVCISSFYAGYTPCQFHLASGVLGPGTHRFECRYMSGTPYYTQRPMSNVLVIPLEEESTDDGAEAEDDLLPLIPDLANLTSTSLTPIFAFDWLPSRVNNPNVITWTIRPALPQGMTLDATTGHIGGLPVGVWDPTAPFNLSMVSHVDNVPSQSALITLNDLPPAQDCQATTVELRSWCQFRN